MWRRTRWVSASRSTGASMTIGGPPASGVYEPDASRRTSAMVLTPLTSRARSMWRVTDSAPPSSDSPAPVLRLLVQCPDGPGIVAAVSQFLFSHGANIMQADQFSTADGAGRFFLRVEFQTEALDLDRDALRSDEHTSELQSLMRTS